MTVLIIAEKPSLAEYFAREINRINPWPGEEIIFISTGMLGFYKFSYPKHLKSKSFPYIEEPSFKQRKITLTHWPVWRGITNTTDMDIYGTGIEGLGFKKDLVLGERLIKFGFENTLADLLKKSRLILLAVDCMPLSTISAFDILMVKDGSILQEILPKLIDARVFHSFKDVTSIIDACARGDIKQWTPQTDPTISYGTARRFFDWNWLINARALLTPTLKKSGINKTVSPDKWLLSKYTLYLLQYLAEKYKSLSFSDGQITNEMVHIKGSGKYKTSIDGIGSPMSRHIIYQNLLDLNLIERTDEFKWNLNFSSWRKNIIIKDAVHIVESIVQTNDVDYTVKQIFELLQTKSNHDLRHPDEFYGDGGVFSKAIKIAGEQNLMDNIADREILVTLGLISKHQCLCKISDQGWKFLGLLPKTAYDPDLPFRMKIWCEGWPSTKPQMEAYLKRYFSSIKRNNGMIDLLADKDIEDSNIKTAILSFSCLEEASRKSQVDIGTIEKALKEKPISAAQKRAIMLSLPKKIE